MASFIDLFINKYLLTVYYMPDTTLGAGYIGVNKPDKNYISSKARVEQVQIVNILGSHSFATTLLQCYQL